MSIGRPWIDREPVRRLWEAVQLTSHELVWALDPDGTLTFLSDAAEDVLGKPAAEMVGQNAFSIVHPDDAEAASRIFEDCVAGAQGWSEVRLRVMKPDGTHVWIETSGVAHVSRKGRLEGFTATTRRLSAADLADQEAEANRARIEELLDRAGVRIVWQPIFALDDGRIAGAEALTRFDDGSSPETCFTDAHRVGLGVDLELLAATTALAEASCLPSDMYLSINLSPTTVSSDRLMNLMTCGPVAPERIVLELTEHVSVDDYELLECPVQRLRDHGVRLAVDDAGAGFASFRHILRLNPDIIKLDRSITHGITANPAQRALATALVLFALDVGSMAVVAEGVETEADLTTVATLGLDAAQGFHLARPAPHQDIDWAMRAPQSWSGRAAEVD